MKVLLLSPNTLQVPYPVYPLGLDYVAGAIAAQHQVQRYDLNSGNLEELATVLASWQPEVIGLACRNIDNTEAGAPDYFLDQLSQLVSWLRGRSQAVLVCGGSGFTIMPEAILALLRVDYGIIGEGERFSLLLTALEQGEDPALIPGVLAPGAPAQLAPPWDGQRRRVLATPEQRAFYVQQGGMLNLQSKRGCSFRCIYCPYPHIEGRSHRLVSPEEVAATALALQQAGARYLFFTDSAFNSDLRHSIKVARALRTSRLALPWGAFFAPLRLARSDAGYFKLMAEAGCCHVEFGTESLSPSMLRNYLQTMFLPPMRLPRQLVCMLPITFFWVDQGKAPQLCSKAWSGSSSCRRRPFSFLSESASIQAQSSMRSQYRRDRSAKTQICFSRFFTGQMP